MLRDSPEKPKKKPEGQTKDSLDAALVTRDKREIPDSWFERPFHFEKSSCAFGNYLSEMIGLFVVDVNHLLGQQSHCWMLTGPQRRIDSSCLRESQDK